MPGMARPSMPGRRKRVGGFVAFLLLLACFFWRPGLAVIKLAAGSEVYSYLLIVPFICVYLCSLRLRQVPAEYGSSFGWAMVPAVAGLVALAAAVRSPELGLSPSTQLALFTLSFLGFMVAGVFAFLGKATVCALAFPLFFAFFSTPLPDHVVESLETASKLASAEAAAFFFSVFQVPVLREGVVFMLPGVVIEVAQECSGIRSSLVLFLTGLLASNFFLKSPWRRALLVFSVIPLGVLRNGFRVFVIGKLCVMYGPEMIHSPLHTRGGPLFFTLSLIPLGLLVWWLARGERVRRTMATTTVSANV